MGLTVLNAAAVEDDDQRTILEETHAKHKPKPIELQTLGVTNHAEVGYGWEYPDGSREITKWSSHLGLDAGVGKQIVGHNGPVAEHLHALALEARDLGRMGYSGRGTSLYAIGAQYMANFALNGQPVPDAQNIGERLERLARGERVSLPEPAGDYTPYQVMITNGGALSIEAALRIARQWQQIEYGTEERGVIVCPGPSYHGGTGDSSAASSGNKAWSADRTVSPSDRLLRIDGPNPYHDALSPDDDGYWEALLENTRQAMIDQGGKGHVAGILVETVNGGSLGAVEYPEFYLQGLASLGKEFGCPLIVDEVMCGVGRTGTMFAFQKYGIQPDIVVTSKALGAGLESAAMCAVKNELVQRITQAGERLQFSHTDLDLSSNCAMAMSVLSYVSDRIQSGEHNDASRRFGEELEAAIERHPVVKDHLYNFRQVGYMVGIELGEPKDPELGSDQPRRPDTWRSITPPAGMPDVSKAVYETARREYGVSFYPIRPGEKAQDVPQNFDTIMLLPPYNLTPEQMAYGAEWLVCAIEDTIRQAKPELGAMLPQEPPLSRMEARVLLEDLHVVPRGIDARIAFEATGGESVLTLRVPVASELPQQYDFQQRAVLQSLEAGHFIEQRLMDVCGGYDKTREGDDWVYHLHPRHLEQLGQARERLDGYLETLRLAELKKPSLAGYAADMAEAMGV